MSKLDSVSILLCSIQIKCGERNTVKTEQKLFLPGMIVLFMFMIALSKKIKKLPLLKFSEFFLEQKIFTFFS